MAIYEQDVVMFETKENGDKVIKMPISRANNIEGIGRSISTAYAVGEVVYVDNNKKVALKCTQAGTTSSSELNVSTASIGNVITDGTVKWQVCNRTSDVTSVNGKTGDVVVDLPVGHMYWSVEPNVPAGRLPAMGATYNRALYADLWAWANSVGLVKSESEWQAIASANDGNCAYYSSGDGSTTFRVPSIKCWVKGASSTDEVGSYLGAEMSSLPHIHAVGYNTGNNSGTWVATSGTSNYISGVQLDAQASYTRKWNGSGGDNKLTNKGTAIGAYDTNMATSLPVKASSSEETKVQPPSLVGQWLIVAFGTVSNVGNADVANVMQAIEQVQTQVGTLEQGVGTAVDYIVESYKNGNSWYRKWKSGRIEQGGVVNLSVTGSGKTVTVTLTTAFPSTNYKVFAVPENTDLFVSTDSDTCPHAYGKTTSNFTLKFGSVLTKTDAVWFAYNI